VVLARDPRQPTRELIKRVAVVRDGSIELRGDAPASADSRSFGSLPRDAVEWRVVFRYWPLSRIGQVPATPYTGLATADPAGADVADADRSDVGDRSANLLGGRFTSEIRAQPTRYGPSEGA